MFMAHCLLNQNTRYPGGAVCRGVVVDAVAPYLADGTGIVQMVMPRAAHLGRGLQAAPAAAARPSGRGQGRPAAARAGAALPAVALPATGPPRRRRHRGLHHLGPGGRRDRRCRRLPQLWRDQHAGPRRLPRGDRRLPAPHGQPRMAGPAGGRPCSPPRTGPVHRGAAGGAVGAAPGRARDGVPAAQERPRMLTLRSDVLVPGVTGRQITDFLLAPTDDRYRRWWPGTHLRFHVVRAGTSRPPRRRRPHGRVRRIAPPPFHRCRDRHDPGASDRVAAGPAHPAPGHADPRSSPTAPTGPPSGTRSPPAFPASVGCSTRCSGCTSPTGSPPRWTSTRTGSSAGWPSCSPTPIPEPAPAPPVPEADMAPVDVRVERSDRLTP